MERSTFLSSAGCAVAASALPISASAAESEIVLESPTGKIYGTALLPSGPTPVPVALIIAGSGPTDRNGNSPMMTSKGDTYRLLAEALAAKGVASVRYYKRGVAASAAAATIDAQVVSAVVGAVG